MCCHMYSHWTVGATVFAELTEIVSVLLQVLLLWMCCQVVLKIAEPQLMEISNSTNTGFCSVPALTETDY